MILTSSEKISDFTRRGWWSDVTLDTHFANNLAQARDEVALVDAANRADFTEGEPKRLSYQQLDELITLLAVRLRQAGVGKDDIVACQLPNIVETVALLLACAKLGAVLTPIAVQYREHEIAHIVARTQPKLFITLCNIKGHKAAELVQQMYREGHLACPVLAWGEEVPEGVASLIALAASAEERNALDAYLERHPHSANDILTICWTSGTDGTPKGVPRSHNHWFAIGRIIVATAQIKNRENLVNPFPMVNMASIGGVVIPWLLVCGKMVLHHPFDLPTYLRQIEDERIHYNLAPPPVLNRLIKDESILERVDLSSLHSVCSGSAPLAPWMIRAWYERYGINVINFFGSNEGTTLVSSVCDVPNPNERAVYFPRFGVEGFNWSADSALQFRTRIVDPETGEILTQLGQQGELRVWGATVFDGYYHDAELNRTAFDEAGYFCTGDLFEIAGTVERPCYYRFVGRLKEIIIRGGQNISPVELDCILQSHPKLLEAAVVGIPDDILGEQVCAAVVPKENESITLNEISTYLQQYKIAVFKLPERMVVLPKLPRNQLDKVVRKELRVQVIKSIAQTTAPKAVFS